MIDRKTSEVGMTIKDAISTLNANVVIACERAGFSSATVKLVEDALDTINDALKEQEHIPIEIHGKIFDTRFGDCPHCGERLNSEVYPHWCGFCGQAVKWE